MHVCVTFFISVYGLCYVATYMLSFFLLAYITIIADFVLVVKNFR